MARTWVVAKEPTVTPKAVEKAQRIAWKGIGGGGATRVAEQVEPKDSLAESARCVVCSTNKVFGQIILAVFVPRAREPWRRKGGGGATGVAELVEVVR